MESAVSCHEVAKSFSRGREPTEWGSIKRLAPRGAAARISNGRYVYQSALPSSIQYEKPPEDHHVRQEELYKYMGGIIRGIEGTCLEINGMQDHVHILAKLPPKIALSDALRNIKSNSSKWVNEMKTGLQKFGWQDGYSAFTVSKSQVDAVRQYICDQKQHHQTSDFKTELLALLSKHEIDYDQRYIWD